MATSVRHLQSLGALLCGVILSIGAFNAQSSEAATYYVATTGSDSNTCMQAQGPSTPKRTINAALNCLGTATGAGAGHTVQVAAGTYAETINNNLPGGTSWNTPFTLTAATSGTVTLQPPVGAGRCMLIARATSQYAIISDLVCDGVNIVNEGMKITDSSYGAASFIRLQDMEIKNAKHHGILVTRSTDDEFIRITVHDNGTTDDVDNGLYISDTAHRALIVNSILYNNHASGIQVYSTTTAPDGCVVQNNRVYANGTSGLVLSATNALASNNVIYNNHTAAGNLLGKAKSALKVGGISNGVKLYNNTVYGQKANSSDKGIEVSSGVANSEVKNNIAYNNAKNLSTSGTNTILVNNLTTTDPQFVDAPVTTDFHLQATSPAIDAGVSLPSVPTDYDGNPRPQGLAYDIGAYEFVPAPVAFDFSFTNSGDQSVTQGATASNPLTATLVSGTAQTVAFSTSGLPAGATAAFSSTACAPTCATTLTLSTIASTPTGTYTIMVTSTGGGVTRTTSFALTVTVVAPPPPFDFALTNGSDQSVTQGAAVSNTITTTLLSGSVQAVAFSTSGLPTEATAVFSPTACSPTCATTLTLSTTASTPTGTYTIMVTGTATGGLTRTTSFALTVAAPPPPFDFAFTNGGNQSIAQGAAVSNAITATLLSDSVQAVAFTVSGLPTGATAAFSLTACAPTCATTLTLSTTASTPIGPYTLTVAGTGGGVTRTTSFSLTVTATAATTYYVATTGSDSNTCVQAQDPRTPKQTINAALNCLGTAAYAGAGQTVQVAAGTYTETINNNLPGGSSWSAPFTLAAAMSGTVTLQPPVGAARCLLIASAGSQYAIVRGLVCDGTNITNEGIKIADSSYGVASFIRIQDTEVKNAKHHGVSVVHSTDNELIHITAHDNGTTDDADYGISIGEAAHRTVIRDSTVYNNHATGIQVYSTTTPPDGCLVRNNRVYTNGTSGVVLWATNTLAYNNVIYNNHTAAGNLLGSAKSALKVGGISTGVKLYNNTVYGQKANSSDKGIEVSSGAANTEVRNSIAYNNAKNLSTSGTNTLLTNNLTTTTDPKFVDAPVTTDFHLQATSPAIDAGVPLPSVPTDCDGNPRPQGLAYDIGAYEIGSGAPAFTFSLSSSSGDQGVTRGASVSIPISATLISGTTQAVAFTVSSLPSPEVIASFSPASCSPPCAPTLTLSPSASTPTGTYPLTVTGAGGGVSQTTTFNLTVNASDPPPLLPAGETPASFTVAFIGDQGLNSNAGAVLQLIKNKGAQLVIHSGDLDYYNEPTAFDNMVTNILGAEFPYLVSRGNHDIAAWDGPTGYQALLQARIDRYNTDPATPAYDRIVCTGPALGMKSSCTYRGLRVLLIDPTAFSDEDLFIKQELANSPAIWNVCSWHYDQTAMQVGGQADLVGWADYEECRKGGAIIATAHQHSYARTRTLSSTQTQTVDAAWPDANTLRVVPGSTFVFHAGIGGVGIGSQTRCLPTTFPYGCNGEWAMIYTSSQDAKLGALFITFNVDGDAKKARGELFNITTPPTLIDSFTITADPFASPPP